MDKGDTSEGKFDSVVTFIKGICIIFLIIMIVVLALQRFSNNNIAIGGYRVFTVATGSMIPVYKVGDTILVKKVDTNSLQINDVITYLGEKDDFAGRVVTHRIKDIEETDEGKIYHTQGDANPTEDPTIKGNQIYGKVVYKFIIISMLTKLMNNLKAFYILVFLPLGFLFFIQIKDKIKEKRIKEIENEEEDDE